MIAFVHDSIEADTNPEDLFFMVEQFKIQMNDYPRKTFGVSTKADVALGASLGEEVAVKKSIPDEDYRGGILELKGHGDEVDRLLACWSQYFDVMEIEEISEPELNYFSWREVFQVKRTFYSNLGHLMPEKHIRVRLRITEGKGCNSFSSEGLKPMKFYDRFLPTNKLTEDEIKKVQKKYVDPDSELYKMI